MIFDIDPENLNMRKQRFPKGLRIELLYPQNGENNPDAPPIGTRGIVQGVDEFGVVRVKWNSGTVYGILPDKDRVARRPVCVKYDNGISFWENVYRAEEYYSSFKDNSAEANKEEIEEILSGLRHNSDVCAGKCA